MSEAWKRNLAVPFFTQRDNTFVWQAKGNATGIKYNGKVYYQNEKFDPKYPMAWRSCNITSLCMLLHYWGITEDTPNRMIEKSFEHFG